MAWGLFKVSYFVYGCISLYVGTDHKPLIPLYATKNLANIENHRLRRLIRKAIQFRKITAFYIECSKTRLWM